MPEDSMPHRLPEAGSALVNVMFEGQAVQARATDTVAAAIIAYGVNTTRQTPVSDSPRGPYCMMGVCFECLMEIDGVANRQACMVRVSEGMIIKRMHGARALDDTPSDDITISYSESDDADDADTDDDESQYEGHNSDEQTDDQEGDA